MEDNLNVQFNLLQWVISCGLAQMDRPTFRPERRVEYSTGAAVVYISGSQIWVYKDG